MKKNSLWIGLLLLAAAGCKTESQYPYAPYYYPNLTPPYSQRTAPATQKVAASETVRVASMSTSPAN